MLKYSLKTLISKWEDKVFIFIDKKKIKIMGEIKIDFYDKGTPAEGFH